MVALAGVALAFSMVVRPTNVVIFIVISAFVAKVRVRQIWIFLAAARCGIFKFSTFSDPGNPRVLDPGLDIRFLVGWIRIRPALSFGHHASLCLFPDSNPAAESD